MTKLNPTPSALSLSKRRSHSSALEKGQGFDKLSPDGEGVNRG
jgi:hypothetical protein